MLAGLLALALVLALRRDAGFASPYTAGHAALVTATGERRLVEPRLSGGFAFGPWSGELPEAPAASAEELALEAEIESASARESDASSRAARAILEIRRGRQDKAIELLAEALRERPRDPRLASDLAAAHLARARQAGSSRDLVRALAAADRALDLDPTLVEARFNRALALEGLHLTRGAAAAWEGVLDVEPASGWADEARQRLARLEAAAPAYEEWLAARHELRSALASGDRRTLRSLVDRHRQPVREWTDDELFGEWADAAEAGNDALADALLETLRTLASAYGTAAGDLMTADAVAVIEGATGVRRARLIEGHRHYREGRRLQKALEYRGAEEEYVLAAEALDAGGSPFAGWARLRRATLDYHRPDLPAALGLLVEQRRTLDADRYPVLSGYVHWVLALVRGRFGPRAAALDDCETSRSAFERAGEVDNLAHMESMIALIHGELGDFDRAWRHHEAALATRGKLRDPRYVENILFGAVDTLRRAGELGPAVAFADETVEEASRAGVPLGLAVTRRQRGELLADLGRIDEALTDFEEAWRASEELPEDSPRGVVQGEILIARGRALRSADPAAAIADLDEAERFVTATEHRHRRIEVLRERALCHLARGDRAAAEGDLETALAEVDRQRGLLRDPGLRRSYLDESREVLEAWVRFRLEEGEGVAALATVERLRAPLLLEALEEAPPSVPRALIQALPAGAALLEFLTLEEELVVWVVGPRGVDLVRLPISREELTRRIDAFREAAARGDTPRDRVLEDLLAGRLLRRLESASSLILVPDGPLHGLPFGAVREPAGGSRLAERFALAVAPSARVFTILSERARRARAQRPASILAVGGVPFDPRVFGDLPALPASEQETRRVAAPYPRSTRLVGTEATAARFLEEAPRHEVVHLATHALELPGEPDLSSLVLSPSADPRGAADGLLPAGEIRFEGPVSTQLVVLAACRSAGGTVSATEGPLSLARPFLAAGVPAVVGSLWDLDEVSSLAFFSRFHAAHAAGSDPLTAFHEARLALMEDPDPRLSSPRSWAGLVFLGAAAGPLPPPSSPAVPGSEPRKESSP